MFKTSNKLTKFNKVNKIWLKILNLRISGTKLV